MSFPLVIGVCLQLAAAPQVTPLFIPTNAFTLAWMHTIEKVRWEEDYEVIYEPKRGKAVLHAVAARIKGSAAGMEPPDNAQFKDGWYHYTPAESYPTFLNLTRSEFSADYDWCNDLGCMPLSSKMPTDGGVTKLSACIEPLFITSLDHTESTIMELQ